MCNEVPPVLTAPRLTSSVPSSSSKSERRITEISNGRGKECTVFALQNGGVTRKKNLSNNGALPLLPPPRSRSSVPTIRHRTVRLASENGCSEICSAQKLAQPGCDHTVKRKMENPRSMSPPVRPAPRSRLTQPITRVRGVRLTSVSRPSCIRSEDESVTRLACDGEVRIEREDVSHIVPPTGPKPLPRSSRPIRSRKPVPPVPLFSETTSRSGIETVQVFVQLVEQDDDEVAKNGKEVSSSGLLVHLPPRSKLSSRTDRSSPEIQDSEDGLICTSSTPGISDLTCNDRVGRLVDREAPLVLPERRSRSSSLRTCLSKPQRNVVSESGESGNGSMENSAMLDSCAW